MSDTPEADKQWAEFLNKLEKPIDVFVDFARKLERERNEAREDAKRATYDATHETIKVSTVKSHWIEACRERDDAREALLNLSALVRRLFALLETVEVSDSEREFHPTVIRSCRVAHTSELAELLPQIKEAVK